MSKPIRLREGRLTELEARLQELGLEMRFDLGSTPGEGHLLVRISDGELVDGLSANVPEEALELAREWSELTEDSCECRESAKRATRSWRKSAGGVDDEDASRCRKGRMCPKMPIHLRDNASPVACA